MTFGEDAAMMFLAAGLFLVAGTVLLRVGDTSASARHARDYAAGGVFLLFAAVLAAAFALMRRYFG
jgi:hypothetical protein